MKVTCYDAVGKRFVVLIQLSRQVVWLVEEKCHAERQFLFVVDEQALHSPPQGLVSVESFLKLD